MWELHCAIDHCPVHGHTVIRIIVLEGSAFGSEGVIDSILGNGLYHSVWIHRQSVIWRSVRPKIPLLQLCRISKVQSPKFSWGGLSSSGLDLSGLVKYRTWIFCYLAKCGALFSRLRQTLGVFQGRWSPSWQLHNSGILQCVIADYKASVLRSEIPVMDCALRVLTAHFRHSSLFCNDLTKKRIGFLLDISIQLLL